MQLHCRRVPTIPCPVRRSSALDREVQDRERVSRVVAKFSIPSVDGTRQPRALRWTLDRGGFSCRVLQRLPPSYGNCQYSIPFKNVEGQRNRRLCSTCSRPLVPIPGWRCCKNDSHIRTCVSKGASGLQPVSTTSNEALHVELRAACRQVHDINVLVRRLRLNCVLLSKQVVFEGAQSGPGSKQHRPRRAYPRAFQTSSRGRRMRGVVYRRSRNTFLSKATPPPRTARRGDAAGARLWKAGITSVKKTWAI